MKIKNDDWAEFTGQIIDGLEDYLTNVKGVTPNDLDNEERDEDDELIAAIIYGSDYDAIGNVVRTVANRNGGYADILEIYEAFEDNILDKIDNLDWTREDEAEMIKYISETFAKWEAKR